ncbi:MerR family transcriptional regulator [Allokutzneria sp. NRRL B-24872]|uniref:MerR family transcriptional regulator n=1 Tax=Allokutzneria sp. NRRL B-24872 TaxID=1137961 RepID=UPI000A385987|nr:MerR family transcriptional regulator [Allokutzneria sp. NRRL B-24872]
MPEDLLPIGRFARLCRLSVKQLRHYDDLGLLRPAHVDPSSGYRYYTRAQTRAALTIGLLRTLDMPLPAIADLLAGDESAREDVLRAERDRIDAQLRRHRAALQGVERLLKEGLERNDIALIAEPERRVAVQRASCAQEEIGRTYGECVARLFATVRDAQGPPIGLFPLDLTPTLDIAAAVETPSCDETLRATPAATIIHSGPYGEISLTYHALFAWIHEHGHTPHGLVRETYLTDPRTTPPEHLVTRITIPV